MVKTLIFLLSLLISFAEEVQENKSESSTTVSTDTNFENFKAKYSVALSDPFSYSKSTAKPLMYIIFAPWSATYESFRENSLTDPLIKEYLRLFEVIYINGDDENYRSLLPKRYWTQVYPAVIAFSESGKLGYVRGEDTVEPKLFYKHVDFWFEKWRANYLEATGKKPIHPMKYFYEEDYKSKDKLKNKLGFLLKTGWVVQGKPINLANKIVTVKNGKRETKLPLHLFTDESRVKIEALALLNMREKTSLVPGPYSAKFTKILDTIPAITQAKNAAKSPVLLLLDPDESFTEKLYSYNAQNPKTANSLTYVEKYLSGKTLSPQMANVFSYHYGVEYPAAMILKSGYENRVYSNLKNPSEIYSLITDEDLIQQSKSAGPQKTSTSHTE